MTTKELCTIFIISVLFFSSAKTFSQTQNKDLFVGATLCEDGKFHTECPEDYVWSNTKTLGSDVPAIADDGVNGFIIDTVAEMNSYLVFQPADGQVKCDRFQYQIEKDFAQSVHLKGQALGELQHPVRIRAGSVRVEGLQIKLAHMEGCLPGQVASQEWPFHGDYIPNSNYHSRSALGSMLYITTAVDGKAFVEGVNIDANNHNVDAMIINHQKGCTTNPTSVQYKEIFIVNSKIAGWEDAKINGIDEPHSDLLHLQGENCGGLQAGSPVKKLTFENVLAWTASGGIRMPKNQANAGSSNKALVIRNMAYVGDPRFSADGVNEGADRQWVASTLYSVYGAGTTVDIESSWMWIPQETTNYQIGIYTFLRTKGVAGFTLAPKSKPTEPDRSEICASNLQSLGLSALTCSHYHDGITWGLGWPDFAPEEAIGVNYVSPF